MLHVFFLCLLLSLLVLCDYNLKNYAVFKNNAVRVMGIKLGDSPSYSNKFIC